MWAACRSFTGAKIRSKKEKRETRKDPPGPGFTAREQISVPGKPPFPFLSDGTLVFVLHRLALKSFLVCHLQL